MEYKIGDKKVFVFLSRNCDVRFQENAASIIWDAIIIEENGDTKMVYHETFKSQKECHDACGEKFQHLSPPGAWRRLDGM